MGKIVFAGAMSHVLDPEYYDRACGAVGRQTVEAVMADRPDRYPLDDALANAILEQGLEAGFDLALSWEAPVDHAFLSPVNTMHGARPIPPLVPIWVNCFVAPQQLTQMGTRGGIGR